MSYVTRIQLEQYLATLLCIENVQDYCPNGLQVEGREIIKRIATGVTASKALLEEAIAWQADAILVHHGYFWRGESMPIVGQKQKRLRLLLNHDLNLFAYHLPLDIHPELGNNAQLAKRLGFTITDYFADYKLACLGKPPTDVKTTLDLVKLITHQLQREPLLIGDLQQPIQTIAWCTGAAHRYLEKAKMAGADVFISGEIDEATVHYARERDIAYLACGHHATERYGIQALGEYLAKKFGLEHRFIDVHNPV